MTPRILPLFALIIVSACNGKSFEQAQEPVMQANTRIAASKDGSSVTIIAGAGMDRSYEFGGCKLHSNMIARPARWMGSFGMYDPSGKFEFFSSGPEACHGIDRTVVEEGQIHFDDTAFAKEWIRRLQQAAGKTGKVAWNKSGLLVSWNVVPARAQFSANVWLMCFNGSPLRDLEGADDKAVRIDANDRHEPLQGCAKVNKAELDQTRADWEKLWKESDAWDAQIRGQ